MIEISVEVLQEMMANEVAAYREGVEVAKHLKEMLDYIKAQDGCEREDL